MKNITSISIDLSKEVFELYGVNHAGKCVINKTVKRKALLEELGKMPQGCEVYMEASAGAHYWSRQIEKLGHKPKQIASQKVKPFVKVHKNDKRDSRGILDAAQRPHMKFVATKSEQQQEEQILLGIRRRFIKEKVALSNEIRGFLTEFGIVLRQGFKALFEYINFDLDKDARVSENFKTLIKELKEEFQLKMKRIAELDKKIKQRVNNSEQAKQVKEIHGVGVVTASALCCYSGNVKEFKNGRNFAASIGLVPRQYGTGGKTKLGGITKSGNSDLRSLLVQGAQTVINTCKNKTDKFSLWVQRLLKTKHKNLVAIAIANKNARIAWYILATGEKYNPDLACSSL